jgi:RNA-directed DNA polymerase
VSMDYRIGRLNWFITGWMAYFRLADAQQRTFRDLTDGCAAACGRSAGRNGKPPPPSGKNLRIRGISESSARKWAGSSKGYWRVAGSKVLQVSLPNSYWNRLGLKTMSQTWQRLKPRA